MVYFKNKIYQLDTLSYVFREGFETQSAQEN